MAVDRFSTQLLNWYDRHARALPWRLPPGSPGRPDPYAIWLSEIMAQQTTVAAVERYWRRFLELWPTVQALAGADEAQVMREWAGLGYYARARNLIAAAREVAARGGFPETEAELRALPGVGPYTAAAIAAIAFGERATVIDANVERVAARCFAIREPLPGGRAQIAAALSPHVPAGRPGDFAQALMDLGASICTPKAPRCLLCPLQAFCVGHASGSPEDYPQKAAKKARPVKQGLAWWIERDGNVALVRRPPRGMLGGMLALPGTGWSEAEQAAYPFDADWRTLPGHVRHIFTHFELRLSVAVAPAPVRWNRLGEEPLFWTPREALAGAGLPTLYARAVTLALELEPSPT
ncbi:A/G-specific adenine glycosylase [Sandaracinobacter sp. RS1-74]|uniref:A/G-specific adenine glycosylase n=1 Tax=Sandaracinobacteroides sayramensis TaxID=2913411 RepID=UPI001EDAFDE7|nr:A/G-specific adenine glycosylase [Sandaracinobacteroides sayramensis]MCG2842527.1 A/G-specific adenine glycosylase [Sandaracinobacteroides sayramensis]